MENLDLIACDTSFRSFSNYVIANFEDEKEQIMVLEKLLEPIKENYETILLMCLQLLVHIQIMLWRPLITV